MIQHEYADMNGIRMHYAVAGEGEPVLLLHGFPEYWGVWKRLIEDLSRDHLVIAPDLRGYNLTSRPDAVEQYGIEHLVADIRGLAEHIGARRFRLVAQDWGALIGWSLVLRHPEYVDRFVSINITHPYLFHEALRSDPEQQQASQYMLLWRAPGFHFVFLRDDLAMARAAIFEDARAHGAELSDADVEEWLAALRQPGAIKAGLNYYRAARLGPPDGKGSKGGGNLLDGLDPVQYHVHVPVLVISGEKDPYLLPSGFDRLHRYVPDLRIVKIPDANHWVTLEKPALVAGLLREFFLKR